MADALTIAGTVTYDGDRLYTDDPIEVSLTVTDPDGNGVDNAELAVSLVKRDGTVHVTTQAQAAADGTATLFLSASEAGTYAVKVHARSTTREGYSQLSRLVALGAPPFLAALPSTLSLTVPFDAA